MPLLLPPKKTTTVIMDRMSKLDGEPKGEKIERESNSITDYDMALEAACEDMMTAFETKNLKLLMEAMKDFHSCYDEEMEKMGYGSEEEEHERKEGY